MTLEKIVVTRAAADTTVACDGGKGGHPRVFLRLKADGQVECPYCGRRYQAEEEDTGQDAGPVSRCGS